MKTVSLRDRLKLIQEGLSLLFEFFWSQPLSELFVFGPLILVSAPVLIYLVNLLTPALIATSITWGGLLISIGILKILISLFRRVCRL